MATLSVFLDDRLCATFDEHIEVPKRTLSYSVLRREQPNYMLISRRAADTIMMERFASQSSTFDEGGLQPSHLITQQSATKRACLG